MVFGHRQALLEQMNTSQDPAQVLHIASLILCQGVTQNMLHASGRYVSILLTFLQPHLPPPTFTTLQEYYGEQLFFNSYLCVFEVVCPLTPIKNGR